MSHAPSLGLWARAQLNAVQFQDLSQKAPDLPVASHGSLVAVDEPDKNDGTRRANHERCTPGR